MALRLTGSPTTPSPATPTDPSAAAAACLDRRDFDGYAALFADVAGIADVHARYLARTRLAEAAMRAAQGADRARVPALYLAAARGAIGLLEEEPREPVLLNYAGVLLYELWSLDAAEALFSAAHRLDPELANVERNLAAIARRRAGTPLTFPRATAVALAELGKRARRVADRARPAEGLRLSLCMIVKDEEEMLPRCLAAAAPAVDEIVIVDTGSSDRTIEIAREFGATVIEREWTGSFSEARNVSFDADTGDWLMFLDADEVLVEEDVERLRVLRGKTWREAFYLSEISWTGELGDGTAATHTALRVFRARPEYRFSGNLHEQIAETLPLHIPERVEATDIRIEHFGYLGAVRDAKEKSRRNIELLLAQRDDPAAAAHPFLHFNIGSEYGAVGDAQAALAEYERAWELIEHDPARRTWGFMPALASRLVRALRICGRHADCIERGAEGLARYPGFTDIVFEQASATLALGDTDGALRLYRRCVELGDAPSRYTSTVGMGTFLPTIAIAELHHARGETAEAVALLDACVAEHPGFFGLVLPFAAALLADGVAPDEVVARVEARVTALTPTVRFMLGTALYEAGRTEAAEAQYRLLLAAQPGSGMARVALAEALLSQKRWAEAAAEAALLPDDDPHAPAARRSELFAQLVADDASAARATLARAASGSMPSGDLALFAAWVDIAEGRCEAADVTLPLDAVIVLATTLEALLRVHEVDAFAALVGLLDGSPLAARERRELLAGMYLRRGFLASAAEEWLGVCQDDPRDVRGLVGLAQVAAAQGMTDDAIELAREAQTIEPGERRATRLLARLEPLAA